MAGVLVCADPRSWQQAGRFAARVLGGAELRTFEELRRKRPVRPILVYLTHPDYDRLRALLKILKSSSNVVIYYAKRLAPQDAAQLGKVVGEMRPNHTSVVFEAKAAATSVLENARPAERKVEVSSSAVRARQLREYFGLTQTEMAHALGVSLRTVQNWERAGVAREPRQLRDLEELRTILSESVADRDIAAWLRSGNEAFGEAPIEMLKQGKARDIIVEFRRLQAGEPI